MLAFFRQLDYTMQVLFLWLIGQAVKTSPSHGENRGSIPLRTAKRSDNIIRPFSYAIRKVPYANMSHLATTNQRIKLAKHVLFLLDEFNLVG